MYGESGPPLGRGGIVGDENRRFGGGGGERVDDAVDDPSPADADEALRSAAVARGGAAGDDGAGDCQ
jgi:hypothetical protein